MRAATCVPREDSFWGYVSYMELHPRCREAAKYRFLSTGRSTAARNTCRRFDESKIQTESLAVVCFASGASARARFAGWPSGSLVSVRRPHFSGRRMWRHGKPVRSARRSTETNHRRARVERPVDPDFLQGVGSGQRVYHFSGRSGAGRQTDDRGGRRQSTRETGSKKRGQES